MRTRSKNIIQSILSLALIVTVGLMIVEIHRLQGTAQVVNYAGLVRGASQRLVKLEIAGNEYDRLAATLNQYLESLANGGGAAGLIRLNDPVFQDRLRTQADTWAELKDELVNVRQTIKVQGMEQSDIVNISEIYFHLCDETVNAAVAYSQRIASNLRFLETLSIALMAPLLALLVFETLKVVAMRRENLRLKKRAYVDLHTGLPNKSRCEELLQDMAFLDKDTACLVFDINNLKEVNDSLGHSAGDLLIQNFARQLRSVLPAEHIVARYGGDEFLVVAHHVTEAKVESLLNAVKQHFDLFNRSTNALPISFACGWAHSARYEHCTLRTLFDAADKSMYEHKIRCHAARGVHPTPQDAPAAEAAKG